MGSLHFFVYINAVPSVSNELHSILFADDACHSLSDTNYGRLIRIFNDESIKFDNWLMTNRLTLNVEKNFGYEISLQGFMMFILC